jgi:uncharacterized protein (TIGR03067 family)
MRSHGIRALILALLVPWPPLPALADDEAVKAELAQHQGTWRASTSVYDGQDAPAEVVRSITRTVEKDHVVWKRDGKSFAGTRIELDPSRDPKAIDVIPDGGKDRGERVPGIYKLEKDTLTICMAAPGQPRPSEFKAEKGSGRTLRTFVREKGTGNAKRRNGG